MSSAGWAAPSLAWVSNPLTDTIDDLRAEAEADHPAGHAEQVGERALLAQVLLVGRIGHGRRQGVHRVEGARAAHPARRR